MKAVIYPSTIDGEVDIPSSKSLTHRALFCASFCDKKTTILNPLYCNDTNATMSCLEKLGVRFLKEKNKITVIPTTTDFIKNVRGISFDVKGSATTLRFLMSICSAIGIAACFTGDESLKSRPVLSFINELTKKGVSFSNASLPFAMKGKINCDNLDLTKAESSQYVSGLMLATPFIDKNLSIITNDISNSYVILTKDVMASFGVFVEIENNNIILKKGQSYRRLNNYNVEGDFSNASYFMACGVLGGKVTLQNLNEDSHQGDKCFIDALIRAGGKVYFENGSLICEKSNLHAIKFDATDCPDIVPILAIVLANARGNSKITGVDRLKYKESNRIEEIIKLLKEYNISCDYDKNCLTIHGGKLNGATEIELPDDHRIIMSAAVCSIINDKKTVLKNVSGINKSYPEFFNDFKNIGGKIDVSSI